MVHPVIKTLVIVCALAVETNPTFAVITTYTNKQQWQAAVGAFSKITFQELPPNTWVSKQYAYLGITFDLTASNYSQIQTSAAFANDGVGLVSFGTFEPWPRVLLTNPTYAIAIDTPSPIANFWLMWQGEPVGNASVYSSLTQFRGISSTVAFDEVRYMPNLIDDLYFGPPIPGPNGLALLAIAAAAARRRRNG